MPSKSSHVAAANRNQSTIERLFETDDHLAWVVTVAFYKALHIVEAVFDGDPRSPVRHTDDHASRNRVLKTTSRYKHLWDNYRPLYEASLIARYLQFDGSPTVDVFMTYMPRTVVQDVIIRHHLHQIQQSAGSLTI
jgi:hypothetical protein